MIGEFVMTLTLILKALVGAFDDPDIGVAAYYREGLMREVCERRVANGWHPSGIEPDCERACLVAAVGPSDRIGERVIVLIPGDVFRLCQVVDCGAEHDLPGLRAWGEVIEVDYDTAMAAGMTGYVDGVRVWWVDRSH